jgi:hypothetical protein
LLFFGLESKMPLMSQKVLFLGHVAVAFVAADIKFSRTVSSVHAGFSGSASLDSGCTGKVLLLLAQLAGPCLCCDEGPRKKAPDKFTFRRTPMAPTTAT